MDTGNPKHVDRKKKAVALRNQRFKDELDYVMRDPKGRAFVWRVLEQARTFRLSFAGEETHLMAFREGRRSVGNWLLNECLQLASNSYTVMQSEAVSRDAADKLGKGDDDGDRDTDDHDAE